MPSCNNLLKYRSEIMGVGVIGILLVHSTELITWPLILEKLVGYGGIGVYLFVFVSAFGLFGSLKYRAGGYWKFEKKRLLRVGIPYFLIAGSWYAVKYLIIERSVGSFLYELSTLSFWIDHQGAWYVAMLIPLYLLYPVYFSWVEKGHRLLKTLSVVSIISAAAVFLSFFCPNVYVHLSQVICSYVIFALANYFSDKIYDGTFPCIKCLVFCLAFYVIKAAIPTDILYIDTLAYGLLGVTVAIIVSYLFSLEIVKPISPVFKFLGTISLEMYLCNIFLIQIYKYFSIESLNIPGSVTYCCIVLVGLLLSILYSKASKWIEAKLTHKGS